jgi:hypothetical protein
MTSIRTHIMNRKVQWSITRCAQCSSFSQACGLPCTSRCRRVCVLIKGRLYYRWLCQSCIERIWGTISPSSTLLSRLCSDQPRAQEQEAVPSSPRIHQPFQRGAALGYTLVAKGILNSLDLTNAQGCNALAYRYAECTYPQACEEDQHVFVAGMLHAWATAFTQGEETR